MTDIYEILRGKKDADGNYEKKPVIVQGITGSMVQPCQTNVRVWNKHCSRSYT